MVSLSNNGFWTGEMEYATLAPSWFDRLTMRAADTSQPIANGGA